MHNPGVAEAQKAYRAKRPDLREAKRQYNKDYRARPGHREQKNARERARVARDPAKDKDQELRKLYGISLSDYEMILILQDGGCAICRATHAGRRNSGKWLHVDHDHETGQVRGLLCNTCNVALGAMRDDEKRLEAAAEYLRQTRAA